VPYLNEATLCLGEGAATASEIDAAMVDFGMPMGPFTLMDMLGIDVCSDVGSYLYSEYGERMTPAPLFYKLIEARRFGEKTGAGFYGYGDQSDEPVKQMIAEISAGLPPEKKGEFSVDRLVMPLINEAALCLQEHIASASDIDMSVVAGLGMTYHGDRIGPLAVADTIGLDTVLSKLDDLCARYGERFRPNWFLRKKVRAGHLGKKAGKGFHEYSA